MLWRLSVKMKDLVEVIYNIVEEWKNNSDNIMQFESSDIVKHFENLSGETWGYKAIPSELNNILNLLKYEYARERLKNK